MKAHLLYRDQDFDWQGAIGAAAAREVIRSGRRLRKDQTSGWKSKLPWNAEALTADLALTTMLEAMGGSDDYIFEVSRKIILEGALGDLDVIKYRQGVLQDCLAHPAVVRELYALAIEAKEMQKTHYLGTTLSQYPDYVLRNAIDSMRTYTVSLKKLRTVAGVHGDSFMSEGWHTFFAMLRRDLDDTYFKLIEDHLTELNFRNGELISAGLGKVNKGSHYVLHRSPYRRWTILSWWTDLFEDRDQTYRFELHPRDEAGAAALGALRNRGISLAATALGQAADHVRDFFTALRIELAFYVGCLNLHEHLARKGEPVCMPVPAPPDERRLFFRGLYDASLALTIGERVVGNDVNGDTKELVVITGPNTGGKSTFLRSVGLAQLMMQSGMFVPARDFSSSLCDGLFTHYKREEDQALESGKFDEELGRMSEIVDHIQPHSMVLFNESFAATNEREGSEIARQIISALLERRIRVFCVTHMYELAHGFFEVNKGSTLFLRAQRQDSGGRTFKLTEGEPLRTSFGEDLYDKVFSGTTSEIDTDVEQLRAHA
jgi:hypothetical protein